MAERRPPNRLPPNRCDAVSPRYRQWQPPRTAAAEPIISAVGHRHRAAVEPRFLVFGAWIDYHPQLAAHHTRWYRRVTVRISLMVGVIVHADLVRAFFKLAGAYVRRAGEILRPVARSVVHVQAA